jgi:glycine cleavage system transcriptional repressor
MSDHAILTALGEDRPGLVNAASRVILGCGCSIEDSRLALLSGELALLVLVSGDSASIAALLDKLPQASREIGLQLQGRRTAPEGKPRRGLVPFEITARGMDHPGIVERVTALLAARSINIRALETAVEPAPHTGQPLFSLYARIDLAESANVPELRSALAAAGVNECIEVTLAKVTRGSRR